MPPKGRKKLKGRAKQDILTTSRLMAISLVVDDYIYNNKPISLQDAMKYDEEVSSLKIKCDKNLRSIQVVEKLKIFMKSIIKEQSTHRLQDDTSSFVSESINNNPLIALNDISENVENNITNNFQANNTTELFSNRENQNSQLNHILQDIPVNSVTSDKNTEIELVEPNIITSKNTNLKINNKSEENIICISKNIDFDKKYHSTNTTNEKEQEESDLAALTASNLRKSLEQEKVCPIQENTKPDEIKKPITKKNKTRKKNKITAENKIQTKTNKNIDKTNKELENKSSGVNEPKKKPEKKMQLNLSWVENIKYVREISPDEHTDIQIEDNFWSNISLPVIWNSNDFD